MAYGALPCLGGPTYAEGTTLVLFLPPKDPDVTGRAIEAVVWLGGTYFNERSNFGLEVVPTGRWSRQR